MVSNPKRSLDWIEEWLRKMLPASLIVVESSNGRMVELLNRRMVEWWSCEVVDMSNGGVLEFSIRQMVKWWSCAVV